MARPADTKKLWHAFHKLPSRIRGTCCNAFISACYIHMKAESEVERKAARKLVRTVFLTMGDYNRKTLFSKVMATLPGNEDLYANAISGSLEMHTLFEPKRVPKRSVSELLAEYPRIVYQAIMKQKDGWIHLWLPDFPIADGMGRTFQEAKEDLGLKVPYYYKKANQIPVQTPRGIVEKMEEANGGSIVEISLDLEWIEWNVMV